jgi:hypothetical protein
MVRRRQRADVDADALRLERRPTGLVGSGHDSQLRNTRIQGSTSSGGNPMGQERDRPSAFDSHERSNRHDSRGSPRSTTPTAADCRPPAVGRGPRNPLGRCCHGPVVGGRTPLRMRFDVDGRGAHRGTERHLSQARVPHRMATRRAPGRSGSIGGPFFRHRGRARGDSRDRAHGSGRIDRARWCRRDRWNRRARRNRRSRRRERRRRSRRGRWAGRRDGSGRS